VNIPQTDRRPDRSGIAKSLLLLGLLSIWLMTPPMLAGSGLGGATGTPAAPPSCPISRDTDLVFLIDASGSMANTNNQPVDLKSFGRGETYNAVIEGLARAFCNRSVIPRDGSVAVAVFKFSAVITSIPMGQTPNRLLAIDSDTVAEGFATAVRESTCPPPAPPPPPTPPPADPCPAGPTLFGLAIQRAANLLLQNHRPGARLVIVMATDGDPTDDDLGAAASADFQAGARQAGLEAELDVVLVGLDPVSELPVNRQKVDPIVFPQPATDLPGATLVVDTKSGLCNLSGQTDFVPNCDDQADQFAKHIRQILRNLVTLGLTVTTQNDTAPGTPLQQGQPRSLRQAIEMANCRGGAATITFGTEVSNIRLSTPLPAIEEPGIVIDGCPTPADQGDSLAAAGCSPHVTIDGRNRFEDGIVIRSQRDSVRNLTIANFGTGIVALDPPAGVGCAFGHNVENTLSQNNFSGVVLPIDLGGDGPTPNDPDDPDEGPNTLLNFPDELLVTTTGSDTVAVGKANGPTVAGATIEIYGITTTNSILASTPAQVFTFLARTTADNQGGFRVPLPIQEDDTQFTGFSATLTDSAGNTSEMRPPCFPQASLDVSNLQFGPLTAGGEIKKNGIADGLFTVMNTGCAPLTITLDSIRRTAPDAFEDNDPLFPVRVVNPDKSETPVALGPDALFTISAHEGKSFRVLFHATIPPFVDTTATAIGLRASNVIPCGPTSVLNISQVGGSPLQVTLNGQIMSGVTLIDPCKPMLSPPHVTLERSGDIFTVKFTVYDCDATDVQQATYDFRDKKGRTIQTLSVTTELGQAIAAELAARNLKTGQSFMVIQRFSGASDHPEVASVLVTVSGARSSASASSGAASLAPCPPASGGASTRSLLRGKNATVVLPVVKLGPSSDGSLKVPPRQSAGEPAGSRRRRRGQT
jgi:hypothetical protein